MNALVQAASPTRGALVTAKESVNMRQYLTFMLAGETLSIDILSIREIIWYTTPTEVPMMPAYIRGVINLRGAAVPVMDLCARFGKASTAVSKSTCIVIAEVCADTGERQSMGVVVDAVQAVVEIASADIEPAPSFGARIHSEFIEGIGKVGGKFVIVLDVNRVLSNAEIGQMGQATDLVEAA